MCLPDRPPAFEVANDRAVAMIAPPCEVVDADHSQRVRRHLRFAPDHAQQRIVADRDHDGQGACLFTKKLERGRFLWPSPADGAVTISTAQMGYLLPGIDWRNPQETWRPTRIG